MSIFRRSCQVLWLCLLLCIAVVWGYASPASADPQADTKFQGIPLNCYISASKLIPDANGQVFSLLEIANKYASTKDNERAVAVLDQALEQIQTSSDNSAKAFLLVELAERYAQAGQKQKAGMVLNQAFTLVKGFPNKTDRVFASVKIARAYAKLEQPDKADRLLKQVLPVSADIVDVYAKSRAYEAIASALISINDLEAANTAIAKGQEYAGMALEASTRSRSLIELAGTYAELKDHTNAIKFLQDAFAEVSDEIPPAYKQDFTSRAFALVVERYLGTQQYDQARQVLDNIPDTSIEKAIGLLNLANGYRKAAQTELALATLEQSTSKAKALPDSLDKAALLTEIAQGYRQLDKAEQAETLMQEVGQIAQKLDSAPEKIYALSSLASQYADLGKLETAEKLLDQSLAVVEETDKTKKLGNRDRAVSDIAGLYWQVGNTTKAQTLADSLSDSPEKQQLQSLFSCAKG